ncbi:AP2-associated protein kinase 1-like isoform X2 [Scylla paramamosain]|uniref:AP2-associated protein kinase 1-like isoform X2 n=1 Tax=Scylla paramamosain TaxID=85552 RepID=UPI00308373AC
MGTGSSTYATEVETYPTEDPYEEEDVDAVATPLRPAYAPASTKVSGTSFNRQRNPCPTFNPSLSPSPEQDQDSESPNNGLPFQPALAPPYNGVSYYPLSVSGSDSVGPDVVLSRVVQVLETAPPPYLLLPDHPNIPPSPVSVRKPPPVPPNTAHSRRGRPGYHQQYPCINKSRSNTHTVSEGGVSVGGRSPDPHPPC